MYDKHKKIFFQHIVASPSYARIILDFSGILR